MRLRSVLGLALLVPLLTLPAQAVAAEGSGWSVAPAGTDGTAGNRPYLVYTLRPGQSVRDQVVVTNTGTTPLDLQVYAVDATSGDAGQFTPLGVEPAPTGVGAWLSTARTSVRVPAGGRRVVPVRLRVPADASPGDWAGAVVTSAARPARSGDGQLVLVDSRVAVRTHVRVSGPAPMSFEAEQMTTTWDRGAWWNPFDDTVRATYSVRNTGERRLAVEQQVRTQGPLGLDLGESAGVVVADLLPGGALTAPAAPVEVAVPAGLLTTRVTVRAVDPVTGERLPDHDLTHRIVAVPWALLGTLGGLLLTLLALRLLVSRRRRSGEAP